MSLSDQIKGEIARLTHRDLKTVTDETPLKSLVSESFVLIEMMIDLQELYEVRLQQDDMLQIQTVGDLIRVIERKKAGR